MAAFPLRAAGRVLDWRQAGSDPFRPFAIWPPDLDAILHFCKRTIVRQVLVLHQVSTTFRFVLAITAASVVSEGIAEESIYVASHTYEEELSDTDQMAVYGLFGVSPNDPEVLRIGGSITVRDGVPSSITAYLATPVAVPDAFTCVVDIRLRFGKKDGEIIDWGKDIVDPIRQAWRFETPGSCEERGEETMQKPVTVDLNVPIQVIPGILELEARIFEAVFHFPEGAPFHDWNDVWMAQLSRPLAAEHQSRYCARFFNQDRKKGPTICFFLHGAEIDVESIRDWRQQRILE